MQYAVLAVNGNINDLSYYKDIFANSKIVVASDGGANLLYRQSLDIDYIIGDLDSIDEEVYEHYKKTDTIIKQYPKKKDKTDSELSIDIIKELGIKKIIMIGALGDRIDHFLTNINLMYYADFLGIELSIIDEKNELILLNKEKNHIRAKIGQTVSFISFLGDVRGISLKGFEYEISDYDLDRKNSILTSNIAKVETPYIEIKKGSLICIKVEE